MDDLQDQINKQVEPINDQLPAQQEAEDRSHAQLKELITRLSAQVMQMANRTEDPGTNGGNSMSRLSQIDFPKFEGDDVHGWIYKREQFFEVDAVVENRKIKIASIRL